MMLEKNGAWANVKRHTRKVAATALLAGTLSLAQPNYFIKAQPMRDTVKNKQEQAIKPDFQSTQKIDSVLAMLGEMQEVISRMKPDLKRHGWPGGGPGSGAARDYFSELEAIEKQLDGVRNSLAIADPVMLLDRTKRIREHYRECRKKYYLDDCPAIYWNKYAAEDGHDSAYISRMVEKSEQDRKHENTVFGIAFAICAALAVFGAYKYDKWRDKMIDSVMGKSE